MNNRGKYKIIYDNLTKSLVLVERDRKVEQDFNFSPKAFAQKFFYKLGEQIEKDETDKIEKTKVVKRKMLLSKVIVKLMRKKKMTKMLKISK